MSGFCGSDHDDDAKDLRKRITTLEAYQQTLFDQITALQAGQTAQLMASRHACYEQALRLVQTHLWLDGGGPVRIVLEQLQKWVNENPP